MEVKLDPKHTKPTAGDEADSRESIAAWDWPLMDKPDVTPESNVLGYASNWYQAEQEPQQAEDQSELEPEQQPLTLEEIEGAGADCQSLTEAIDAASPASRPLARRRHRQPLTAFRLI